MNTKIMNTVEFDIEDIFKYAPHTNYASKGEALYACDVHIEFFIEGCFKKYNIDYSKEEMDDATYHFRFKINDIKFLAPKAYDSLEKLNKVNNQFLKDKAKK